jgi:hypothetical protein
MNIDEAVIAYESDLTKKILKREKDLVATYIATLVDCKDDSEMESIVMKRIKDLLFNLDFMHSTYKYEMNVYALLNFDSSEEGFGADEWVNDWYTKYI